MDLFVRRDLERKRTAAGVRKALRANGYTEGKTRANITKYTNVTGDTIKVAYTKKAYGYTSDAADLTVNEFWFDSTCKPLVTVRFYKEAKA